MTVRHRHHTLHSEYLPTRRYSMRRYAPPIHFIHRSLALAGRRYHSGRYTSASKHPVASARSDSIDVITGFNVGKRFKLIN